jgi:hypothetical protein
LGAKSNLIQDPVEKLLHKNISWQTFRACAFPCFGHSPTVTRKDGEHLPRQGRRTPSTSGTANTFHVRDRTNELEGVRINIKFGLLAPALDHESGRPRIWLDTTLLIVTQAGACSRGGGHACPGSVGTDMTWMGPFAVSARKSAAFWRKYTAGLANER